jgi:bifunctional non-homologous end joining protein LigD
MNNEFVIRIHHALRAGTHEDLHLDGLSFAVPKGVPLSVGPRHLAIKTTYHTPEQARFEGTIPEGEYGAGETHVLDQGSLEIIEQTPTHIFFKLLGDTYRGNYHLRHWTANNWLIWKAT